MVACKHGGKNYWKTYAPVVHWASICILLAGAKIHGLSSKSLNFVLAFPHADFEIPVFMELPFRIDADSQRWKLTYTLVGEWIGGWNVY
jgi:hypothetical protein